MTRARGKCVDHVTIKLLGNVHFCKCDKFSVVEVFPQLNLLCRLRNVRLPAIYAPVLSGIAR